MGHGYALDRADSLHPASHALPEGGRVCRVPSRLCLPGLPGLKGRAVRVRSLALWLSVIAHVTVFGVFLSARLAVVLPEPPPLIDVEFVEIPGAKGGGGPAVSTVPVAPKAAAKTFAPAPQAVALRDPASRQTAVTTNAPAASGPSTGTPTSGNAGGSGGGSGGGTDTGVGASVGSGTGQGGMAVDRMPVPVRQIKPRYPLSARRQGQSGQVLLRLFVDQDGAVREVTVVRAEPVGVFEDAAVDAVRKWQFSPAVARGAAVGMWMTLPVRFALDER